MTAPKPKMEIAEATFAIDIKYPISPYSDLSKIDARKNQKKPSIMAAPKLAEDMVITSLNFELKANYYSVRLTVFIIRIRENGLKIRPWKVSVQNFF